MDGEAGGDERVVVLDAVLLGVDDDDVGLQGDNGNDVGVLGAADGLDVGLFAEPRACDDIDVPREERLGDGRNQADDTGACHPDSSRAFWASYSAWLMAPARSSSWSFSSSDATDEPPPRFPAIRSTRRSSYASISR